MSNFRTFWRTTAPLKEFFAPGYFMIPMEKGHYLDGGGWYARPLGAFRFVPLVMTGGLLKLVCKMDVTILSRDEPGAIINGGDLDNRMKVLLDALTVPQPNQWQRETPEDDERPFFCLLDDDHLITEISIRTARLHRPMRRGEQRSDVEIQVKVTVQASPQSESPLRL